ncbi:hypothetical protein QBC46DRAFT_89763 [Diplogelasinospora grovesii]|uniref:Uncharacterized protein n=1 Tax=Diplogelasinospora grovesii TaxID=303347 RepID=A0AAN6S6P0_9PEZI|nr:hypothetical protein QBC46DRAFT_89763 [Diplogelasinospora grovesii]
MQSTRFQSITARFNPRNLRTSFRRSSSMSSRASSTDRNSLLSQASSPVSTINSIILRQRKSMMDLDEEEERKELNILEPRPAFYIASLEERMGSF